MTRFPTQCSVTSLQNNTVMTPIQVGVRLHNPAGVLSGHRLQNVQATNVTTQASFSQEVSDSQGVGNLRITPGMLQTIQQNLVAECQT